MCVNASQPDRHHVKLRCDLSQWTKISIDWGNLRKAVALEMITKLYFFKYALPILIEIAYSTTVEISDAVFYEQSLIFFTHVSFPFEGWHFVTILLGNVIINSLFHYYIGINAAVGSIEDTLCVMFSITPLQW